MAVDNLRELIGALDACGECVRVERPVSVDKEITEIADRCMKSPGGGPALLFTHPTLRSGGPSRYPLAVHLFGAPPRMAPPLGVECLGGIRQRTPGPPYPKVPPPPLRNAPFSAQRPPVG